VFEFLYKAKMPYSDTMQTAAMIRLIEENCARIIQRNCENWIFKPVCKDGKLGIRAQLMMGYINEM
jgi:hypothetical protein